MTDGPLAERLLREAVRLAGQCDAKLDAVATKHDLARAVRWFAAVQARGADDRRGSRRGRAGHPVVTVVAAALVLMRIARGAGSTFRALRNAVVEPELRGPSEE